jgi:uncharacterized protein involved in outer membrane biogenesis
MGPMKRMVKWLAAVVLGFALLVAGVALALQQWVGTADFRQRVAQQISTAAGVPVQLSRVSVDVWPLPAVALDDVRVGSTPPLTLQRVEARPEWASLLRGRLEVATLVVRGAVIPEQAVAALVAAGSQPQRPMRERAPAGTGSGAIGLLPRRTLLENVTWAPAQGAPVTFDAEAHLDPGGRPELARVHVVKGRFQGARASLQAHPDHWALRADIGGGTVVGKVRIEPAARGGSLLQGQFDTSNVEVTALTAPNRTLGGRIDAQTRLRAPFQEIGAITDSLQTDTRFTVRDAVVHGIDLAQAVKTVGMTRGGQTRLDTLAGQVSTRGRAVQLTNLVASSGLLSATGHVAMAPNRSLSGRITVDLASAAVGGALGVPLAVGGTLDEPSVTLTRGALVGAAVGTLLAPGAGTGAGAKLGDRIGEGLRGMFGK